MRHKALGKDSFIESRCAECALPNVTLGNPFAECFMGFAECPLHSANAQIPVVILTYDDDRPNQLVKQIKVESEFGSC